MPAIPVVFKRFDGGWSTGNKLGLANSQAYTEALDFRKNPSQLTVLPKLGKESASVVTDLVTNAVMVTDGSIYSIGDSGNFYKRTTAGSWSLIGSASAGPTQIISIFLAQFQLVPTGHYLVPLVYRRPITIPQFQLMIILPPLVSMLIPTKVVAVAPPPWLHL